MTDQNTSQSRQQPNSYPSPHSYPSPSLSASYTYPPHSQGAAEPYRASPTAPNMALPSLNLPPIRAMDGQAQSQNPQQQQPQPQQPPPPSQAQQPPQQTMGSPLPAVAPMSAYYPAGQPMPHPGQQMAMNSVPHGMQYALPVQGADQRIMSGGRHKKEIKRRTKTGCLTCRKRRIKCDEAHPTCRNCQKSKRECLGYDPIFKQQPNPATLQPAPSAAPPPPAAPAVAAPPAGYSNIPQGYAPAATAGYVPDLSAVASAVKLENPSYDYGSAIDPALAGTDTGSVPPGSYDSSQNVLRPKLEAAMGTASPYSAALPEGQSIKAKQVKIEELFTIGGYAPLPESPSARPIDPAIMHDMKTLYNRDYAPGMDKFLETNWYSSKSLPRLLNDTRLCELFASHIRRMAETPSTDQAGTRTIRSLEAKLVWNLFCLCRYESPATNGANGNMPADHDPELKEVQTRLQVVETLLTGDNTETNLMLHLSYPEQLPTLKYWEVEFWRLVGEFISMRADDPSQAHLVDITLTACRNILGMLENRDVLYSIMIARHIGARTPDFPDGVQRAYSNDDQDPRSKLFVAKKFIEDESDRGTTQVIQRLCDLAIGSWTATRS